VVVALRLVVLDLDCGDESRHHLDIDLLDVDGNLEVKSRFHDRPERLALRSLDQ